MTVLLTPQKETKAVTVLVLVGVGSRYESDKIAGISHFLEHMMFKGTQKRPTTLDLSKELDQVGAEYNAFTSEDRTGYWIKINSEHLELALDMLSDMLSNSKLEEKEIRREKGTILEEINMYEDDPRRYSGILLGETIFKGNSLGRDIAGSKQTVRATNRAKMLRYKNEHYTAKNMVISVAGNLKEKVTQELIDKYFGTGFKNKDLIKFDKFKSTQTEPQINLKYKDSAQAHLAFGFLGPGLKSKDLKTAQLLSIILGDSMSSRLFINIRERHGLCYYIFCRPDLYQDIGSLDIHAGLDKKRIYKAVELILKELRKIKTEGVTNEELKKAQEFFKGKLILNLEDSHDIAAWYGGQQLLIGKTKTPQEKIKEIMSVKKDDVDHLAKKIFQTKKINLALIGPFKDKNKFEELLKI